MSTGNQTRLYEKNTQLTCLHNLLERIGSSGIAKMSGSSNSVGGDRYAEPWRALAGWFLGPRAENRENLSELLQEALQWHADCRESYYPADPCYFTDEVIHSNAAKSEIADLKTKMREMHTALENSIPVFSTRYQGHMTWDVTMPSMLGYFSGLLWNQNNVDSTASPVTTQFEVEVGKELCDLMRFPRSTKLVELEYEPWGHLTGCGSVANIEAMWAARNLKFHPIALQGAINDKQYPRLRPGAATPVYIPKDGKAKPLGQCTQWELLNLNVDTVCSLTEAVKGVLGDDADILDTALESHSIVQIGFPEFVKKHNIGEFPVVCSPGTNHYSWPKAATLLGIGDRNVIPINVDGKARLSIEKLKIELDKCLLNNIPVYMVVAVIGSTEESAIDPLDEIISLRNKYALDGLNFCIHADSAWGGYLNTMTVEPSAARKAQLAKIGEDYMPTIPLSEYAERQYKSMNLADTITIDPHKAAFCPYPAGALLYRNGTMKGFITLAAPEVFHNPDDLSVGVYGLEGSKPGAIACGVLLSHRVIGLDQFGYGRILGQCQLGSKLFYCMWALVAFDKDTFTCDNFIDFPWDDEGFSSKFKTEAEVKQFIKDRILRKSNADLANDTEAMNFLKTVGPDALINSFTINVVGNSDVVIVNDLQSLVFNELNVSPGQVMKRVPLFLTTSTLAHKNYGEALDQLKRRVGVPDYTVDGNTDSMAFLRNTCMEPYQCTGEYVTIMGQLFKNTVMTCIGALDNETYGDPEDFFTFVLVNKPVEGENTIYLDLMPKYNKKQFQYHVILTMTVNSGSSDIAQLMANDETVFVRTTEKMKLFTFLRTLNTGRNMVVWQGDPESLQLNLEINASVKEVFRFNHLPNQEYVEYPDRQTYFLYGDEKNAYMSHVMTKKNDFHQVVRLSELPHSIPVQLLDMGLTITIPAIEGSPLIIDGKIVDPLGQPSYTIDYRGVQYVQRETTIRMSSPDAKVWFDGQYINA